MITLKIDSQPIPLWSNTTIEGDLFNYNSDHLQDVESTRNGRRTTLSIPASPASREIFGRATELDAVGVFNAEYHHAALYDEDVLLIEGVVHLKSVEQSGQGVSSYLIEIRQAASDWAERAALTDIAATKIEYQATLSQQTIADSWGEQSVVRFLPVHHDTYPATTTSTPLTPCERILSVADYHPFLSLSHLLRAIFEDAGYTIQSSWIEGDVARSLMMSGAYSRSEGPAQSYLKAVAGFTAGRSASCSATAMAAGIVYATPLVVQNSVGNFVDSCDATYGDELYNNNSTLTIDEQGITFTPPVAMDVGFDFHLCYTTPYRIATRNRLYCFDRVCIEPSCDVSFEVANPFVDRRNEIASGVEHLLVLFDGEAGQTHRVRFTTPSATGSWSTFTSTTTRIVAPTSSEQITAEVELYDGAAWSAYTGDWALYQGYVAEVGEIEVEVDIAMAPQALSPSQPKNFSSMYFAGGEPGWELTLLPECRLKPRFGTTPAIGSELDFAAVAQHNIKQIDVVAALQQMFNLCIVTDNKHKRVYIEPYDVMYESPEVDWRAKILLDGGITRKDAAQEVMLIRQLRYQSEGGGSVDRYNTKQGTSLGAWSAKTNSYIARQGVGRNENRLFCPTITLTEVLDRAPSAAFLSVGNRDSVESQEQKIRVVRYGGLITLPEGESWGFPSAERLYPFASFHYPAGSTEEDGAAMQGKVAIAGGDEGFTLCFEDRDGQKGLNSYYRTMYDQQSYGEYITLQIELSPREMVALHEPTNSFNLLSRYRLQMAGVSFVARIDAITHYDVESHRATIRFARMG